MQASLVQRQRLGLKMSPQMYQAIKLMELPLVDLREKVSEELQRNPALELVEDRSEVSLSSGESRPEKGDGDRYPSTGRKAAVSSDEYRRFMEGVPTRPETLQQHLLWQLRLEPTDAGVKAVAETLIQNLDDDGFHREPPASLFPRTDPKTLEAAMALVRGLDPVGCCTADFRESLRAQIALLGESPGCEECPLDPLRLLERGRTALPRGTKCERAFVCTKLVERLSPFPGRGLSAGEVRFVVPDVRVTRDGGDFSVTLNDEVVPVLGINPFFRKLSPEGKRAGGKAATEGFRMARQFARENVNEARVFINSIAMRGRTLKQVVAALLDFQRAFFTDGPRHLVPLTLGDVASEIGIHQATVSRIVNGKYVQTEWGIFELRRLFTNSISGSGSSGSGHSKEGVKELIRQLIETEAESGGSLSDGGIAALLAERGIPLARRTVAKYRNELSLDCSYSRKHDDGQSSKTTHTGGRKE